LRPEYNYAADIKLSPSGLTRVLGSEWYAQAISNPYGLGTSTGNYTDGHFDLGRGTNPVPNRKSHFDISQVVPGINHWAFMGGLACDYSPHLYRSVQEEPSYTVGPPFTYSSAWYLWWGEWFLGKGTTYEPYAPFYEDVFGPNPWYHSFNPSATLWDNPYVYLDSIKSSTKTQLGITNPLLTIAQGDRYGTNESYLFIDHPTNPQRHAIYTRLLACWALDVLRGLLWRWSWGDLAVDTRIGVAWEPFQL